MMGAVRLGISRLGVVRMVLGMQDEVKRLDSLSLVLLGWVLHCFSGLFPSAMLVCLVG